ncbi:MAG: hypothetical protein R3208_18495 [Ketobacteraceae bacterium]|nr:hypothetical protein [Ketobacteraceae bacterium]
MGICGAELLELVIRPTLRSLGVNAPMVENLLLGTAAVQSNMGFYLNSHHGIGIYGIDEERHQAIWDQYLAFNEDLASHVRGLASQHEFLKAPHAELACNLRYATAIAWMIYQEGGVHAGDLHSEQDLAECWYRVFARENACQSPETFSARYTSLFEDCEQAA